MFETINYVLKKLNTTNSYFSPRTLMLILIEMDFNGGRGGGYHDFFLVVSCGVVDIKSQSATN